MGLTKKNILSATCPYLIYGFTTGEYVYETKLKTKHFVVSHLGFYGTNNFSGFVSSECELFRLTPCGKSPPRSLVHIYFE